MAAILGAILLTATIGTVLGDYARLRHQQAGLMELGGKLASNEALLAHVRTRAREISDEIESWRSARLAEPRWRDFKRAGGEIRLMEIGAPFSMAAPPTTTITEDMTRLLTIVKEQGERLHSLESFVGENRDVVASLPSSWPVRGSLNSDFGPRQSPFGRPRRARASPEAATHPMSPGPYDTPSIPTR